MTDFEIRYNAVESANLIMIQRLLIELARLNGDNGEAVFDRFRNAVVMELSDAKERATASPRDPRITEMSKQVVAQVSKMAKERYAELKAEGGL